MVAGCINFLHVGHKVGGSSLEHARAGLRQWVWLSPFHLLVGSDGQTAAARVYFHKVGEGSLGCAHAGLRQWGLCLTLSYHLLVGSERRMAAGQVHFLHSEHWVGEGCTYAGLRQWVWLNLP